MLCFCVISSNKFYCISYDFLSGEIGAEFLVLLKADSEKPSKPKLFFSLGWAVWFKTENTCFCLKFLTVQFDCEEVSSLFCPDSSLYRSVCQCTMWGHYPDWGHQGDLYSLLCHQAGHAGNWGCCLHAKWDQCSQSCLFCFGTHWSLSISARCPLKQLFSVTLCSDCIKG